MQAAQACVLAAAACSIATLHEKKAFPWTGNAFLLPPSGAGRFEAWRRA